ncbi:DinB family protein [Kribbella turkmenica]|uniref:DinB family protein n=1 Tax=Kribbella turkmenica TaxID=2530375 RepID=A0A4R4XD92_9ACTN|nr:DinB family protein [Kribbella turkmenica]TDD28643.1 DinB family protein [Kribbella turkmenica]
MALDEHGRPETPLSAGEVETLVGFLEYQRATFAWRCSGLDAAGLGVSVGASTMTLGGMLKHLAYYEDNWFSYRLRGNERQAIWADENWDADPDWEWNSAAQDAPEELRALWQDSVSRSRELLAEALADGGLDQPAGRQLVNGRTASVRWIVFHMIEEYARHNGHADLIRESIDGQVGE